MSNPLAPTLPLCSNGPRLSRLVYGTWRILDDATTAIPEHLAGRLSLCQELGLTTIDTAEIYGGYNVEEFIGRALAKNTGLKTALQWVTKCGIYVPCDRHPERKTKFYNADAARLVKSAEKSLRLMGLESIDLYLVHRPDWLTPAEETARGLERLLESGKVKSIGVSNYTVHQVDALNAKLGATKLGTNQVELSLFQMASLWDGTLDQCQRLGLSPMVWSPLGSGRLFSPADETATRLRAVFEDLSPKYADASPMTLALAWVLEHPSRPAAVFGTNQPARIHEAAAAMKLRLSREDWYRLLQAAQGHEIP